MPNYLSPVFNEQTFNASGSPLVGGQVETYIAGSSTPLATYTTQSGTTPQANPIILNARGEPTNPIWLAAGKLYKFVLMDALGSVIRTIDNVGGVNDTSLSVSEWQASGFAPTYISAVSFTVIGDRTGDFAAGLRIRSTNSGGTIYSTISSSSYSSGTGLTTVTVRNDSGTLDAGLSAVDVGILTPVNPSVPNSQAFRQAMGLGYGADIASAATLDLTARTGAIVRITGTTATTAVTLANGDRVLCYAVGAWPLTYNVTTMPLPGASNYTCSAGDLIEFFKDNSGTISVNIYRKNGIPVVTLNTFDVGGTVAANALTVTLQPCSISFRSTTLTSGSPTTVTTASALTLTVPSGATLGTVNAVQSDVVVLAINNAGTMELAVVNLSGGNDLSETGLISTTTISSGATSASTIYSTTGRSNVAYRVVGFVRSTQATAGTWASAPSLVQAAGGNSANAMSSLGYGQTWQNVTRNAATTYYNTTGKPIFGSYLLLMDTSGARPVIIINGVQVVGSNAYASVVNVALQAVIPPGASYTWSATSGAATMSGALELR